MIKEFDTFVLSYLNESMKIDSRNKLRDAVHDIVMGLSKTDRLTMGKLSKILNDKYNIKISADVLEYIFFKMWLKDDYSIFTKDDKSWLDAWEYGKVIERRFKYKQTFGKGRRKAGGYYYYGNEYWGD